MIYDVIGVGFGPSNIALAIAMQEAGFEGKTLFLERHNQSLWHQGMLLDGSDIQNNPILDLVTPVNPRSEFTFVNYLHQSGRLFQFANLGVVYALRKDFAAYIKWAAGHFTNVQYDTRVCRLDICQEGNEMVWAVADNKGSRFLARKLVLATGRNPNVPDIPGLKESKAIIHFSSYLESIEKLNCSTPVAVVGASQSAGEILLDLLSRGFLKIYSIHRSFSYRSKDHSPFSNEVDFPDFIEYFYSLPVEKRQGLERQVWYTNYSSVDQNIADSLYLKAYEGLVDGKTRLHIFRNSEIKQISYADHLLLDVQDIYTGKKERLNVGLLILATGFLDVGRNGREGLPWLLKDLSSFFHWHGDYLNVTRNYRVVYRNDGDRLPELYLNGLCESSHGLGDAGSFSLVSLRARDILGSLAPK